MKKNNKMIVLSMGYWFGAHSLGLLIHPYQSMRRVVRQGVFVPLVLLPSVCLAGWWFLGIVVGHVAVLASLGFGWAARGLATFYYTPMIMYFVFVWVGIFLILWQGLLWYLYVRFSKVLGQK